MNSEDITTRCHAARCNILGVIICPKRREKFALLMFLTKRLAGTYVTLTLTLVFIALSLCPHHIPYHVFADISVGGFFCLLGVVTFSAILFGFLQARTKQQVQKHNSLVGLF